MRADGVVSLWVGRADSAEALEEYLRTGYTEDGDRIPSQFARDFAVHSYDEDFREARFDQASSQSLQDLLQGYSYDTVVIPKFLRLCGDTLPEPANAAILLYNFRHDGGSGANTGGAVRVRYMGSVTLD